MYTDTPLKNKEGDKLGRYFFAEQIANGLVDSFENNNESIVLGINGAWGSGKSTLMNFIINAIEEQSKEQEKEIIVLRFNPWMFSGQKELQSIFLEELYFKFKMKKGKMKGAAKKMGKILDRFSWIGYIHSGTGEAIKDAKSGLDSLSKGKGLAELKADLDKILIKSNVKLYITIDDIDRLRPTEITEIFQLVKLNGNFANTIFLLAYDKEVVTGALEKQFGQNGKNYLEKIVQIDYSLPKISKNSIGQFFLSSLLDILEEPQLKDLVSKIFNRPEREPFIKLFKSLRDIYRFNNSIKIRLVSIYDDLNIRDFFLVEALRMFKPKVYDLISESKELLTQKGETEYNLQNVKGGFSYDSLDDVSKDIIQALFSIDSPWTNDILMERKNIASYYYFDRYFSLRLHQSEISEDIYRKFIEDNNGSYKLKILEKKQEEGSLINFLAWLEQKSRRSKIEERKDIIFFVLLFSDRTIPKKVSFFEDMSFGLIMHFCSKVLERLHKVEGRRDVIQRYLEYVIGKEQSYFSAFYLVLEILQANRKRQDSQKNHVRWSGLFHSSEKDNLRFVEYLEEKYKMIISVLFLDYIKNNSLNDHQAGIFLPKVPIYCKNLYQKNFIKYISSDNNLLKILRICMQRQVQISLGEKGFKYTLSKKHFFDGMDIESIKLRVDRMDKNEERMNKKDLATCKFFLQAYEDGFQDDKSYRYQIR